MGSKFIMKRKIILNNPAGWNEYEKYGIGQMKGFGYNGVFYDSELVIFNPNQIKSINNDGSWDINDNNIYS
jgi:hypothetical protein